MNLPVLPSRPDCTLCDLHPHAQTPGMATLYDTDSLPPSPDTPAVVFIGKSPSFFEEKKNEPFAGPSGVVTRRVYRDGISLTTRASVYYTNAVRCRTGPGDPDPKQKQMKACRSHLVSDLTAISETSSSLYLVLCGSIATQSVLQRTLRDALKTNGLSLDLNPSTPEKKAKK